MDFADFILPPPPVTTVNWQIGAQIKNAITPGGIALLWVSDLRGSHGNFAQNLNFYEARAAFYRLAQHGFDLPIADLGDLVSGKTLQDTHWIVQEFAAACFSRHAIPVLVGGTPSLSYPLVKALGFYLKNISYNEITPTFSLENGGVQDDAHYLSALFGDKEISLKNFTALGIQNYLNDQNSLKLLRDVDFDAVRLSEMFGGPARVEHFFRRCHVAAVNAGAVESRGFPFALQPNVNGLDPREICGVMKEIGMSEVLKTALVSNLDFQNMGQPGAQLLAQMLWHLAEGIGIRNSHPKEQNFETFWVMAHDVPYAFRRDVFTDLWYFGADENIENCLPCSREEYERAKKGDISVRFLRPQP